MFGAFYNACLQGIEFAPTAPLVCGPRGVVGTGLWQANSNPNSTRLLYGPAVTNTGNIDSTYATGPNFDLLDSYGAAATVDWDFSSCYKLRSITIVRRLRCRSATDADGSRSISSSSVSRKVSTRCRKSCNSLVICSNRNCISWRGCISSTQEGTSMTS